MKKAIISSLVIWLSSAVIGSFVLSMFLTDFPLKSILFDAIGSSLLLSLPSLILLVFSTFLINKLSANYLFNMGLLLLAGGFICYLNFIMFRLFVDDKFSLIVWNRDLFFYAFLIYFFAVCLSILFWKGVIRK